MREIDQKKPQSLELKQRMHLEHLTALAKQGQASFALSIINALVVVFVLRPVVEEGVLILWFTAVATFSVLRLIMVFVFFRIEETSQRFKLWLTLYLIGIYCSAATWAVLPTWGVFFQQTWIETFIVFVITGMSAGGLVALYPLLRAAIPYLLIILSPLIYVLSTGPLVSDIAMAVLASLFLFLLVRSTYFLNRSLAKMIKLEIENDELFRFLLDASHVDNDQLRSLTTRNNADA